MSRNERRLLRRELRKQATHWPERLVSVPESEWPHPPGLPQGPRAVWRSRQYLVVQYDSPPLGSIEVRRLTVNRVTMRPDGQWEDNISWDDLQRLKTEAGYGDWYALEVYPRDRQVVKDCHMRHLWVLSEPIALGWF